MLGWFRAIMPREERFIALFDQHARIIVATAAALRKMFDSPETAEEGCRTVVAREAEADAVTREVLIAVRRTFITPFDRSGIKGLINAMDDAVDEMQRTAKLVVLYRPVLIPQPYRAVAGCIERAAALVVEATSLLAAINTNVRRLSAIAEEIGRIEDEADRIYDEAMHVLFAEAPHAPLAFYTAKEILEHLEAVVDKLDDVGDEISGIVIEQV